MRLPDPPKEATSQAPRKGTPPAVRVIDQRSRGTDFVIAAVWLMLGIAVGAGVLLAIASYRGIALT